jgi:hypothetical protein
VLGWIRQGGIAPHAGVLIGLLLATAVAPVFATEPDGHIELRAEWIQSATGQGPSAVRLNVRSLVALKDAKLTVSTPDDLWLLPAMSPVESGFSPAPTTQHRQAIRKHLHDLDPQSTAAFDFVVTLSPGRTTVVEFIVEGRDSAGRTVRNAVGLSVGGPASVGVRRMGAIEFPATIVTGTEEK